MSIQCELDCDALELLEVGSGGIGAFRYAQELCLQGEAIGMRFILRSAVSSTCVPPTEVFHESDKDCL